MNDYVQMYTLIKKNNIVEIINTRRAYRDFLLIIEDQTSILAQMHEYQINTKMNKEKLLFKVIEKFRTHIKLREVKKFIKNTADNSIFSTFSKNQFNKIHSIFLRSNALMKSMFVFKRKSTLIELIIKSKNLKENKRKVN